MAGSKFIWPVGGGKGGAGKSVATANIGCALAMMGRRVVLVDADPGGAGLHNCFGIGYPARGLDDFTDFINGRLSGLDDAAVETGVAGLRLISGAGEFLSIANPPYARKQKIIRHIRDIDADCVIIDIGAGSSYNALDFFAISKTGIIVLVPEPASIQNAYIFLKSFVYRTLARLFAKDARISGMIKDATDARRPNSVRSFSALCDLLASEDAEAAAKAAVLIGSYRPRLLLNMAASKEDLLAVEAFSAAAKTFLSIETEPVGVLHSSPPVKAASRRMRPFMLDPEATIARRDMALVVEALLAVPAAEAPPAEAPAGPAGHGLPRGADKKAFGFNDNVPHNGAVYHVQTEAHGGEDPVVETIVYNGGRVFFSKRVVCKEGDGGGTVRDFARRQHRAAMAAIKMDKINFQG